MKHLVYASLFIVFGLCAVSQAITVKYIKIYNSAVMQDGFDPPYSTLTGSIYKVWRSSGLYPPGAADLASSSPNSVFIEVKLDIEYPAISDNLVWVDVGVQWVTSDPDCWRCAGDVVFATDGMLFFPGDVIGVYYGLWDVSPWESFTSGTQFRPIVMISEGYITETYEGDVYTLIKQDIPTPPVLNTPVMHTYLNIQTPTVNYSPVQQPTAVSVPASPILSTLTVTNTPTPAWKPTMTYTPVPTYSPAVTLAEVPYCFH